MKAKYGNYIIVIVLVFVLYVAVVFTNKPKKDVNGTTNEAYGTSASYTNVSTTKTTMSTTTNSNINLKMIIDKTKKYTATLHTELGDISIELYADKTPITVNNFVSLAKTNFYNDVIFHRTIPGFMIQGGDPLGTGYGGPGYKFDDEQFSGEYERGVIAMANSGPNTNGSQFFIMVANYPLPKNYVIFGKVSSGIEVVDKIVSGETVQTGEKSKPVNPVKIKTIDIVEK